jgi:hypothetical protein
MKYTSFLLAIEETNVYIHIRFGFVNSKPFQGEVYSIQQNVIKFVSNLRQVDCFLRLLMFHPPIKLGNTI